MERTTVPFRGPSPVIYRSLPVLATATQLVHGVAEQQQQAVAAKEAPGAGHKYPSVTTAMCGQVSNPLVLEALDLGDLQKRLRDAGCVACELRRTPSLCELQCVAAAKDGKEHCKFAVTVWTCRDNSRVLVQADRYSGCAFYFRRVIAQAIGTNNNNKNSVPKPLPALFRCRRIEESNLESKSEVDVSSVESAIRLATSKYLEQRVQGIEVLSELLAENPGVMAVFRSLNGFERIQELRVDANPFVQRAVSRILVSA